MERNGAALLSIRPHSLHVTAENVYTIERGAYDPAVLVKDGEAVYLRVKLDVFWAHARGKKGFGVLSGERYMHANPGIDFYLPVNPWHYATPVLRKVSESMRTEEDLRLTILEKDRALAKLLADCPLQRCPGLASKAFDGELAFQFKKDAYLQYCKDKISLLAAADTIGTTSRAIEFSAQFLDSETVDQLRRDLGVVEHAQPRGSPAGKVARTSLQTASTRRPSSKQRAAPKTGPIDAFLRAVRK